MKKTILFATVLFCFTVLISCNDKENTTLPESKTITVSAGGLFEALTPLELVTITNLTVKGTIDERDFMTMSNKMPVLTTLDLSATTVAAYYRYGTNSENHFGKDTIPAYTFYSFMPNTTLKSITLPASVTTIDDEAFAYCWALTTINLPSTLRTIERRAFNSCIALNAVVLPASLTKIEEKAFSKCTALITINIPAAVTQMGRLAENGYSDAYLDVFEKCTALKTITVDPNNTSYSSIEGVVFNKSMSEILCCPNGKTGSYSIPTSVTEIGSGAFMNCSSINSISIPISVTIIGNYAFKSCNGLNSLYVHPPVPLHYYDFESNNNITLYVPTNSVEAYKASYYWNECKNIVAM